jgi:hypothetical protein
MRRKPDPRGLGRDAGRAAAREVSTSLAVPLDASNAAFHGKDSHSLELVLYLLDYARDLLALRR